MKPKEIRKKETGLEIFWSDDTQNFCEFGAIRKSCSCAICKEAKTPLNEKMPFFQRSVSAEKIEIVGNYALEIFWADGHRSIVSFDRLRTHEV